MFMARVLLVGGYPSLRLLYFFHLTKLGCDVISARQFSEALRFLQIDYRFEVIFVNLSVPLEAGLAFIDFIRKIYPSMPFVVTAPANDQAHTALDTLKAEQIIIYTPASIDDLEQILESLGLLRRKSERDEEDSEG
jgi:DNA-binding NtrC family response regulator